MTDMNLDEMIKRYEKELIKTYGKRDPSLKNEEPSPAALAVAAAKEPDSSPEEENIDEEQSAAPFEEQRNEELAEPTSTATFFAKVSTGSGAYPVANAKVIVSKGDRLYAFLTTDENGETPKVVLPALPEADSFDPEKTKTVEYYARVYAEGFEEKSDLLVSAVGSSEIFLGVELTPLQERME